MREDSDEAVARRLKMLRKAVGENQTVFAARLDIDVKRWNNFESGGHPLSKAVAFAIVRRFPDLTLDWLWLGRVDGLTLKRQRELEIE